MKNQEESKSSNVLSCIVCILAVFLTLATIVSIVALFVNSLTNNTVPLPAKLGFATGFLLFVFGIAFGIYKGVQLIKGARFDDEEED